MTVKRYQIHYLSNKEVQVVWYNKLNEYATELLFPYRRTTLLQELNKLL